MKNKLLRILLYTLLVANNFRATGEAKQPIRSLKAFTGYRTEKNLQATMVMDINKNGTIDTVIKSYDVFGKGNIDVMEFYKVERKGMNVYLDPKELYAVTFDTNGDSVFDKMIIKNKGKPVVFDPLMIREYVNSYDKFRIIERSYKQKSRKI